MRNKEGPSTVPWGTPPYKCPVALCCGAFCDLSGASTLSPVFSKVVGWLGILEDRSEDLFTCVPGISDERTFRAASFARASADALDKNQQTIRSVRIFIERRLFSPASDSSKKIRRSRKLSALRRVRKEILTDFRVSLATFWITRRLKSVRCDTDPGTKPSELFTGKTRVLTPVVACLPAAMSR